MYITPQTNIRLLHNVPIDSSYVHSLFFASASGQTTYFQNLTKYNLNNYTYQRYDKGVLRVQILADNLYDVNYMMFQNRAFGNKWFYAFVDKVEYLNDVTTAIYYHIDEIQTWLFDWNFAQCFVERMHTPTDVVGDNIVPEPLEVGEYVYNNYDTFTDYGGQNTPRIIVGLTDVDGDKDYIAEGKIYDRVYGGLTLYAFPATDDGAEDINALITLYGKKAPDTIVTIYMIPHEALSDDYVNTGGDLNPIPSEVITTPSSLTLGSYGSDINGYTPRNNKLFTYPYNFENVGNGEGANLALRYEFFNNKSAQVFVGSTFTQPVQVYCCPKNYKGVTGDSSHPTVPTHSTDERIVLSNYPSCSWNIDSWKVWWAQNAVPIAIKATESALAIGITSFKGGSVKDVPSNVVNMQGETIPLEEVTSPSFNMDKAGALYALHTISNLLQSVYKASIQADVTKGNISSANAMFTHFDYGFKHGRMSVNRQQAEIIDNFFDRFGYAVNRLMTPSLHTRTNWTFIKTIDCTIHGSIPRDSEAIIENAFNNGITFWARPSVVTVGDYSQNNAPLT